MRNAKLDLAKRQSVGIVRPIQRFAVGTARQPQIISKNLRDHRGVIVEPVIPVGVEDRRPLEAEKPIFNQGRATPVNPCDHPTVKVKVLDAGMAHGADRLNRKTSRATPQARGHMMTFQGLSRQALVAPIKQHWNGPEYVLIPRK